MLTALYVILYIAFAVTLVGAFFIVTAAACTIIFRVPYVPTPKRNVEKIMEVLALKPGEVFYDLGCGDGRFVIEASRRGAKATGFEITPWPYLKAKINLWLVKSPANILYKNFNSVTLSKADAVFCFLISSVMPALEKKLLAELKPGARVVSYGFTMPTWQPSKTVLTRPEDPKASKIHLYIKN